jgi:hypothetical protein
MRAYAKRTHGGSILGGYVYIGNRTMIIHVYLVLWCFGVQFN